MTDEPDTTTAGVAEPDSEEQRYVCPECGEGFRLAMRLGLHRKREHGVEGQSKSSRQEREQRRRGGLKSGKPRAEGSPRRPSESSQQRRARAIRETLLEFVEFTDEARGRSEVPPRDLADVIRRDASKLANSLAWAAERFNPLAWAIDQLAGHGGVITFVRGFMGVGTWLVGHWRRSLDAGGGQLEEPLLPVLTDERAGPIGWTDGRGGFFDLEGNRVAGPDALTAALNGGSAVAFADAPPPSDAGPDLTSHV